MVREYSLHDFGPAAGGSSRWLLRASLKRWLGAPAMRSHAGRLGFLRNEYWKPQLTIAGF
jgi:hypothetical protein